jgi:aminomethyltransferase
MAAGEHQEPENLARTPLHAQHVALGARMVPFAGYEMPVQYRDGIIAEHNWTRESAGLFDVSHMGQAWLIGLEHETVAQALEAFCAADVVALEKGRQRYSQLLNAEGGILDDFMVSRPKGAAGDGRLFLIVNAARKAADYAHIAHRLPPGVHLLIVEDRALLALQGPRAHEVAVSLGMADDRLTFMDTADAELAGIPCHLSRTGYTGEDGYEISVAAEDAVALWNALLADERVRPVGLGARDSLRLEAGLCLYGHDIDESTSPVEAALNWSIGKRRRAEGGFPGYARIRDELANGPSRKRVGLVLEGRQPAREGAEIATPAGDIVGRVTSGGFAPTLQKPIAMGYVATAYAGVGNRLNIVVRGKPLAATIVAMPFVPNRYKRANTGA